MYGNRSQTVAKHPLQQQLQTAAPVSSSTKLIKVGIINNDPNESGYRTANNKDLRKTFCEANGFDASTITQEDVDNYGI